jgi:hypothetical protein
LEIEKDKEKVFESTRGKNERRFVIVLRSLGFPEPFGPVIATRTRRVSGEAIKRRRMREVDF